MKRTLLFLCSILIFNQGFSQGVAIKTSNEGLFRYKNSASLELGGHGLVYSFNYERNLINTKRWKTSFQAGVGVVPKFLDLRCALWVPISFNQLVSFGNHHLETGVGMIFTQFQNYSAGDGAISSKLEFVNFFSAKIGYRYQKPEGRMTYKVLFTPIWGKEYGRSEFVPTGAFSIGYNF